jgi:hypothetical protein
MQLPSLQQPVGHEVLSQTQLPFTHSCPAAHAGLVPHTHCPALEQPSPDDPHVVQAPPSVPQLTDDAVSHAVPLQHPFGHEAASHTHAPLTHA